MTMTIIKTPEQIKALFAGAGYSIDLTSAEIVMDYIEDAGIRLETDNNKLYILGEEKEEISLKNVLTLVQKQNEKKFLLDDLHSREYTKSLIDDEKVLFGIKSSVTKRFDQLIKQNFKSGSAASAFANLYKETLAEYTCEINPELNYRFFTEETAKKMFKSGKFEPHIIQNIVGLYAPEAVINDKAYGRDIVQCFNTISKQQVQKQGIVERR